MTMANGDVSMVELENTIQLQLKYDDRKENLKKYLADVHFLPTASIEDVIGELLRMLQLENLPPENVDFVGLSRDRFYRVHLEKKSLTLEELQIESGCTLSFQGSISSTGERPASLSIWLTGRTGSMEFHWYPKVTTLGMLLEYVIEVFSLEAIPRERVHLFLGTVEFDLGSDYDKLLKDLTVLDAGSCDVEIIPPLSDSQISENTNASSAWLALKLEYTDHFEDIHQKMHFPFLRTTTIHHLLEQCPQFFHLPGRQRPEKIELLGYGLVASTYPLFKAERGKSLAEIGFREGDTLFFGPASADASSLIIQSLDQKRNIEYPWDTTKSTLGMLLNDIIKEFSLHSVDRTRIQLLIGSSHRELDHLAHAQSFLTDVGIQNHQVLTVKVLPSQSPSSDEHSSIVRVECAFVGGMKTFHVSNDITVADLKSQIAEQFDDSFITHWKLFDRMHSTIETNDPRKTLADFGVQSREVVYAAVQLSASGNSLSRSNSREERTSTSRHASLVAKEQPEEVTIVGQPSFGQSIRLTMSVYETIQQLLKKSEIFKTNDPSAKLRFTSGSIILDSSKPDRRLTDFGIKSGDTIHVDRDEKIIRKYELEKSPVISSAMLDYAPKNYEFSPLPIGLANLGNTCYMNSALQCLAHVQPLTEFFLNGLSANPSEEEKDSDSPWNYFYTIGAVSGAYADVLKHLWRPKKSFFAFASFRPEHIKETIALQAPRFATYEQQDAQEFLTHLLDEIHKELKDKLPPEDRSIVEELFFGTLQSTITCRECEHQTKSANIISFLPLPLADQGRTFNVTFIGKEGSNDFATVHVPEDGQVKNIVEAYITSRSSGFFLRLILAVTDDGQVELEMPVRELRSKELMLIEQNHILGSLEFDQMYKSARRLTLDSCLREFCAVELLEDAWFCQEERCHKQTTASKELQFSRLPSILIIQLKRFSHGDGLRHKIDTFVEFPMNGLNLSSFLPSDSAEAIYDLFAVCNHTGSIYAGHYIAYARHESNGRTEWQKFDDSITSSFCSSSEIVSKNAYLLFYIRRDTSA